MVEKIAFVFPGQGSQYVGMGKKAFDSSTRSQYLFEKADRVLGFSISQIMFEGPEEKLRETSITQPALFLASAAALELVKDLGIKPSFSAGHSLGEYSALYSAGVVDFESALKLVHERGKSMQEAGQSNPGTMAAVLGLPISKIEEICSKISHEIGACVPANFNSDSQIVISGTKEAIAAASEQLSAAGALKVVQLNVSGAFHSPLMSSAVARMTPLITDAPFTVPDYPVVTNVDAQPTSEPDEFKKKLIEQIDHSVLWFPTVQNLFNAGVQTFIEVGSGRVLSTIIKKLDRKRNVFNTDEFETIEKELSILKSN